MKTATAFDAGTPSDVLIEFKDVTLRIRDRHILPATHWRIRTHQNWAILGPNGSGKTTLMRALAGETPVVGGYVRRWGPSAQPRAIGLVSFECLQQILAGEQMRDEARQFSGAFNTYLSVAVFLNELEGGGSKKRRRINRFLSDFEIKPLLNRPFQKLSNGESRKILILKALMNTRRLLILDEPFAGLDEAGRRQLKTWIEMLVRNGIQVIMATHRHENVLPVFSHIMYLKDGKVFDQGRREHMLVANKIQRVFGRNRWPETGLGSGVQAAVPLSKSETVLIDVRNAAVRYGDNWVFSNLNWQVKKGENWAVSGPNGSGKTTLMQLISADHPQAYANEIYLFGKRRGSGESIWEIKQRFGIVSSEFQINYRKPIQAEDVVLSGFFDSVGLYRRTGREQRQIAQKWMRRLNLFHLREKRYDLLSYGERRLVLLARAMVKSPEILVLDEPCQGLDMGSRRRTLDLLDELCSRGMSQLIYVTHYPEEKPACIQHVLTLAKNQG
jgi:molybdate transport system ATP-binding protein